METQGDPRVHFVMNLVLSAVFVYVVLTGLDFVGAVAFTVPRFAGGTLVLMLLTHVVTR